MKLLIVAALCLVPVFADRLENTYLPPNRAKTSGGSGSFLAAPRPFAAAGGAAANRFSSGGVAANRFATNGVASSGPSQPPIPIIKSSSEVNVDGSFQYEYETANGISAQEVGSPKSLGSEEINSVQGIFSYTGDDGVQYSITYTADENGFQPQGAHIPTAPPIPAEILKALEQNAADEAAGIIDDGSYKESDSPAATRNQYLAPRSSSGGANSGYKY